MQQQLMAQIYEAVTYEKCTISKIRKETINAVRVDNNQLVVFLSVSDKLSRAYVSIGKSTTMKKAIEAALEKYHKNKAINFKPASVKLDILTKIIPFNKEKSKVKIRTDKVKYNRGLDGIAIGKSFKAAFLPEEVIAYRMIRKGKIRTENILNAFEKHFLLSETQLIKSLIGSSSIELYKFRTKSYYIDHKGTYPLYRGHRIYTDLTKQDLWESIKLTKENYFKNVVNSRGKYIYSYSPQQNKAARRYNILRHAGTTYAMIETYELMPDEDLLKEIKKAIQFIIRKTKDTKINGHQAKVVVERDVTKLGGNALAIVALAKYTQVTKDKQYIPVMQSMATWIRELQDENGRFAFHKQRFSTGEISNFVSHYYPGEAILALVRLYQIDHNEKWLDVAENEANYLINVRDKNATIETVAHDHWLLYALNELYRERPKEMYIKHSFFIARAIMNKQLLDEKTNPEWKGSYRSTGTPRSTPVACRSEGLSAVHQLAVDYGYDSEAEKIKKAIHEGIKFQLQMQLRPESTMYYENKNLCLGAFHKSLKNYELRNDYTQHNISSLIAYYNILKKG